MITKKVDPKIVFLDIENAPNIGYTWSKYETNVIEYTQDWFILCVSWKWLGGKVESVSLPEFPLYKKDKTDDKEVVTKVWQVLNEADIVVGHNAAKFDLRKLNARFIHHNLTPPSQYSVIDTLRVARKYFQFDSNKLGDLGKYLGIGQKIDSGGFETFKQCMDGDMDAWIDMVKYNRQDVVLLEKLYYRLRPWIENHPLLEVITNDPIECPICAGKIHKRGAQLLSGGRMRQRFQCQNKECGKWSKGRINKNILISK